jgi:hypothetical protein
VLSDYYAADDHPAEPERAPSECRSCQCWPRRRSLTGTLWSAVPAQRNPPWIELVVVGVLLEGVEDERGVKKRLQESAER